ncbi:MAG: hypothetical protein JWQ48_853 [Conexibacter sp.]|nr:hypothetical protein [Conexibacter sp.]
MTPDQPQDQGQPTEEEMRAALAEELRRVRVEQVVMEATVSILNVAVMRAGLVPGSENERDLDQVRFGIEAVRGLLPLVEQVAGDQARPIRDALSQLQMAYVQAREESGGEPGGPAGPGGPGGREGGGGPGGPGSGPGGPQPPRRPDAPGQGQSSGRLWVPGQ